MCFGDPAPQSEDLKKDIFDFSQKLEQNVQIFLSKSGSTKGLALSKFPSFSWYSTRAEPSASK